MLTQTIPLIDAIYVHAEKMIFIQNVPRTAGLENSRSHKCRQTLLCSVARRETGRSYFGLFIIWSVFPFPMSWIFQRGSGYLCALTQFFRPPSSSSLSSSQPARLFTNAGLSVHSPWKNAFFLSLDGSPPDLTI